MTQPPCPGTLGTYPHCPKKMYLISLSSSVSLSLHRSIPLPVNFSVSGTTCAMSARATSARSTRILESPSYGLPEDDLGSPTLWSPSTVWSPTALEMHSMGLTEYSEDSIFSRDTPSVYSAPHRTIPPRPSAPHLHSHSTHVPADRCSRSHISISSDSRRSRSCISVSSDDPDPIQLELTRLRQEIRNLETERTGLQNQLIEVTYVSNPLCH